MRKRELIRRIKAGAIVYAPIATENGRDWQYAMLDGASFLYELENYEWLRGLRCDAGEHLNSPIWFEPVIEVVEKK